jgi:HEAT repeat protein
MIFLQIDLYEIPTSADEWGKLFYSFPIHIRILMGVILIFCMVITVLFAVIIGSRIFKTNRNSTAKLIQRKYQPVFTQLLFEDDSRLLSDSFFSLFEKKDLQNKHRRSVLLEELIHLHENFTGETATRLELIYRKLDFHKDSQAKLKSRRWYLVAKGLRELALMNIREATEPMLVYINSKNELLRMEARIALVKLNEKDPLFFLSKETESLTAWDMANLHAMLAKLPEENIPFFSTWLNSSNKSVVLFCISMIGAFKQNDTIPVLLRMLDLHDESVRQASIKALREMNALEAEEKLVAMYPLETPTVQNEILKSLEAIASEKSISLFDHILRQPVPDLQHALHSIKALLLLGDKGKAVLKRITEIKNERIQLIISHAADARL